jgi:UDP-N-acetyl-D-galactosamine dehydrogenase
VVVADPWANAAEVEEEYGIHLSVVDAAHKVDSLVVAVGHNEFRALTPETLRSYCRATAPVLADVKAIYSKHEANRAGFTTFRL